MVLQVRYILSSLEDGWFRKFQQNVKPCAILLGRKGIEAVILNIFVMFRLIECDWIIRETPSI